MKNGFPSVIKNSFDLDSRIKLESRNKRMGLLSHNADVLDIKIVTE